MKLLSAIVLLGCCTVLPALDFQDADIVVASGSPVTVRYAAEELAAHLRKLTGGEPTRSGTGSCCGIIAAS